MCLIFLKVIVLIMALHFSKQEFEKRKLAILNSMKEQNLDALLMFSKEEVCWRLLKYNPIVKFRYALNGDMMVLGLLKSKCVQYRHYVIIIIIFYYKKFFFFCVCAVSCFPMWFRGWKWCEGGEAKSNSNLSIFKSVLSSPLWKTKQRPHLSFINVHT